MVHGLLLATITGRLLSETPFVQVSMTWALTCPETRNRSSETVYDEGDPNLAVG